MGRRWCWAGRSSLQLSLAPSLPPFLPVYPFLPSPGDTAAWWPTTVAGAVLFGSSAVEKPCTVGADWMLRGPGLCSTKAVTGVFGAGGAGTLAAASETADGDTAPGGLSASREIADGDTGPSGSGGGRSTALGSAGA